MPDVVCATAFGDLTTGGGLFALEDGRIAAIDRVSSLGLATDGRRVARVLHCAPELGTVGELVISDQRGVTHYLRLDDIVARTTSRGTRMNSSSHRGRMRSDGTDWTERSGARFVFRAPTIRGT
jgi:hypothetical protein